METRPGYYSEQVRDEAYKLLLEDVDALNENCAKIMRVILDHGPHTLQQISVITGLKEHIVSARIKDLRTAKFICFDKKIYNPETNKPNSIWKLNPGKLIPKQLNIFE